MFYSSLFVFLSFFFWPLCCLFFFDLQLLGSISQKVVSLRLIVSVVVNVISKLLIGWNSHLRLILDLQLFVKSTSDYLFSIFKLFWPPLNRQKEDILKRSEIMTYNGLQKTFHANLIMRNCRKYSFMCKLCEIVHAWLVHYLTWSGRDVYSIHLSLVNWKKSHISERAIIYIFFLF